MNDCEPFVPFVLTLTGAEDAVRDGIARVMARLCALNLSDEDAGTVELVLAEALNNIVEHALPPMDKDTLVKISGTHDADGLQLQIVDQGVAMPSDRIPAAISPQIDVAIPDIPEGGFGWFMIQTLATEVAYARVDGANHLSLRLSVGR